MPVDRPRMMFGRFGSGWVALCLVCIVLVGCVKATPTPEPVTISFAHPRFDSDYYQGLVQKFHDLYPYIDVELAPKQWDMLGGLGAGDADVFATSQFALNWLEDQGNVLNLAPFIEQDESFDLDDFFPGTVELYTKEGKIWAVPAGVDVMVMFYNQDLFDQYGVPYPRLGWTWDDFLETASALRDPGANTRNYFWRLPASVD